MSDWSEWLKENEEVFNNEFLDYKDQQSYLIEMESMPFISAYLETINQVMNSLIEDNLE